MNKRPPFPKAAWRFPNFILRMRSRGLRRRRGRCAVSAAGIHDDAGAFPGFNEAFAGIRAVELQNEIVQVGDLLYQTGGVGVHFFQERAAVHNLAARIIHHAGKGGDGGGERGNARGGHAARPDAPAWGRWSAV